MKKEFLLCNFYNCRQHGLFSSLAEAKGRAFDIFHRSRIKERYLLWHIIEFVSEHGCRKKVDDHYFKIESFAWPHDGIAC